MNIIEKIKTSMISMVRVFSYKMRMRGRKRWCITDLLTKLPQAKPVDKSIGDECKLFWKSELSIGGG